MANLLATKNGWKILLIAILAIAAAVFLLNQQMTMNGKQTTGLQIIIETAGLYFILGLAYYLFLASKNGFLVFTGIGILLGVLKLLSRESINTIDSMLLAGLIVGVGYLILTYLFSMAKRMKAV